MRAEFMEYSHSVTVIAISLPGKRLVEIEIANGFAGVRRFFGLLDCFLKFLFQKISGMLLRFYRLTENGFAAAILLFHGLGRGLEIVEHLGLDGGGMRDDPFSRGIDLQHGAAARAGYIESRSILRHTTNHSANKRP
jgi:hypothetical protein